jgi:hypothetical protein
MRRTRLACCARGERPCDCRAAKSDNEFPPCNVDCHFARLIGTMAAPLRDHDDVFTTSSAVVIRYKTTATARWTLMFGVRAFINYTIAVAVWTRFCFHVFLMWGRAICGAFVSGICILGWTGRYGVGSRTWISLRRHLRSCYVTAAITGIICRCSPGSAFDLTGAMQPTMLAIDDEMIEIADFFSTSTAIQGGYSGIQSHALSHDAPASMRTRKLAYQKHRFCRKAR